VPHRTFFMIVLPSEAGSFALVRRSREPGLSERSDEGNLAFPKGTGLHQGFSPRTLSNPRRKERDECGTGRPPIIGAWRRPAVPVWRGWTLLSALDTKVGGTIVN
jgi:hypothetical protein